MDLNPKVNWATRTEMNPVQYSFNDVAYYFIIYILCIVRCVNFVQRT